MARHEQRHQLVAKLDVRHRGAVLVARLQQHGHHVVAVAAAVAVVRASALVDRLVDDGVGLRAAALELLPRAPALKHREHRGRTRPKLEDASEAVAQRVQALARLEPEHRPQDHLEREGLQTRMKSHRLVTRPARHLVLGHLLHQAREPLHLLAVEGRQHQLALAEMGALVEQDHRVRPDHRLEDLGPLAGMEHLGRRGEELAKVGGIGEVHERRRLQQPHREALPVAGATLLEERNRARPPAKRLKRLGKSRPWRKPSGHGRNVPGPTTTRDRCVRNLTQSATPNRSAGRSGSPRAGRRSHSLADR